VSSCSRIALGLGLLSRLAVLLSFLYHSLSFFKISTCINEIYFSSKLYFTVFSDLNEFNKISIVNVLSFVIARSPRPR
jgi:hypothetical protein